MKEKFFHLLQRICNILTYSYFYQQAMLLFLSLTLSPLVGMLEFVLHNFALALKQKQPDLKCIFGPCVY